MIPNDKPTHHSASLRGGLRAVPPGNTRLAQNRREPEGVLPGLRELIPNSPPNLNISPWDERWQTPKAKREE